MRVATAALGLLLSPAFVFAHHSRAEYDSSAFVEMSGELVEVRWRSPHPTFTLRVESPAGGEELRVLEGSSVYSLERAGIGEESFPLGERVRVAGWRSTRRPSGFLVTNMLLPDGRELLLLTGGQTGNRWSEDFTGGQWENKIVNGADRGIFRVWSAEDRAVFIRASLGIDVELTEEGKARMAELPDLDPCIPQGMPPIMVSVVPIQFLDRGDHIELQLSTFGVLRRIEMTDAEDSKETPASHLGYSVGHWDGNTLEVRTTRVSWPFFDDARRPLSENAEILERFALVDDGNRLTYSMTVTDPAYFASPVTLAWNWIDIGEEMRRPGGRRSCSAQDDSD